MTSIDDKTREIAIERLQEAGFGAPEILRLLTDAHGLGRVTRRTGAYAYHIIYNLEAGYQVSRTGGPAAADTPDVVVASYAKPGWYMAGVGTIDALSRKRDQVTITGDQGERTFGRYDLVEVTRTAPVMWAAEWPYPEFTPAEFTAHYLLAADVIAARGYFPQEINGYAGEPGISITGALKVAALERAQAADPQMPAQQWEITAANVAEELETRLSAVIYMLGLLHNRTGISDFSDQLAAWELAHYTTGPNPTKAEALALLATAAGMFTHISDTQAEVTAPAVPGL